MKSFFLFLLKQYKKWISPLFGPRCRFSPSCSSYTEEAVLKKGAAAGALMSLARILKCHPFHPGGYDPVE